MNTSSFITRLAAGGWRLAAGGLALAALSSCGGGGSGGTAITSPTAPSNSNITSVIPIQSFTDLPQAIQRLGDLPREFPHIEAVNGRTVTVSMPAAPGYLLISLKAGLTVSQKDSVRSQIKEYGGEVIAHDIFFDVFQVKISAAAEPAFINKTILNENVLSVNPDYIVRESSEGFCRDDGINNQKSNTGSDLWWRDAIKVGQATSLIRENTSIRESTITTPILGIVDIFEKSAIQNFNKIYPGMISSRFTYLNTIEPLLGAGSAHGMVVAAFAAGETIGVHRVGSVLLSDRSESSSFSTSGRYLEAFKSLIINDVKVINFSIGSGAINCGDTNEQKLLKIKKFRASLIPVTEKLMSSDILLVWPVGNWGVDNDDQILLDLDAKNSPNFGKNIIFVGGTSVFGDLPANFSGSGKVINIFAPSEGLGLANSPQDTSTTTKGTSYAGPQVAGAAANVRFVNPTYTAAQIKNALLKDHVQNSV